MNKKFVVGYWGKDYNRTAYYGSSGFYSGPTSHTPNYDTFYQVGTAYDTYEEAEAFAKSKINGGGSYVIIEQIATVKPKYETVVEPFK